MNKFFELIIILFFSLTPLLWYQPGEIALGHDMGFPLNPIEHFWDRTSVWTQRASFGYDQSLEVGALPVHGLEALVKNLGFSINDAQKITYIFWFAMPMLAVWFLFRTLKPEPKDWFFRLFGALFYGFNHFMLQGWFIAERTKFSLMAALPISLVLMYRFLQGKLSLQKTAIFLALTYFFFNGGGFIPLYGASLITLPLAFVFLTAIDIAENGWNRIYRWLKLFTFSFLLFTLLNSYWLLPQLRFTLHSYSQTVSGFGGISQVIEWTQEISKNASLINLFRLQGIPDWYDNPTHPYASFFLNNPILLIVSFIWPLLAFGAVLLVRKKKEKVWIYFFALLALVGMIATAGTHPPLGQFYEWVLKHLPGFLVFRTPFYKFGPTLWLAYAVLVAYTLNHFVLNKPEGTRGFGVKTLTLAVIILPLLYSFPFFTGSFFNWRFPLTTKLKVPDYVFEVQTWIEENLGDDRMLALPLLHEAGRADIYRWGYFSLASLPSILTVAPVVSNTGTLKLHEYYQVKKISDELQAQNLSAQEALLRLGIKYILLRKDVWWDYPGFETNNPYELEKSLNELPWLEKETAWGEWLIYRVKTKVQPLFYLVDNGTGELLSEAKVSYNRLRPSEYQIELKYAPEKYRFVFNEGFSENWQLLIDEQAVPAYRHGVINDFANYWEIEKKGRVNLRVFYAPQRLFDWGLRVTMVTSIVLLGYLGLKGKVKVRF